MSDTSSLPDNFDNYQTFSKSPRKGKIKYKHDENTKWKKINQWKEKNNIVSGKNISQYDVYKSNSIIKKTRRAITINKTRGQDWKIQQISNELGPDVIDVGDFNINYYYDDYYDYDYNYYDYLYNRPQRRRWDSDDSEYTNINYEYYFW